MKSFFLSLFIIFGVESFAQTQETTISNFNPSGKIYNKHTGEKISDREFGEFIRNNPRVSFEFIINKYGEVEKYLLDMTTRTSVKSSGSNQVQPGEEFPEFVFNTVEGRELASKDLLGNWILVRFELTTNMVSKSSYLEFDQKISQSNNEVELEVISCFKDSKTAINNFFDSSLTNIHLVADAQNFNLKYDIIRWPTNVLIDPQGKVVKYFFRLDEIDLDSLNMN